MKKFDIKNVFSWSNAEDAKQYIGKECYFADSIFRLQDNINNNEVHILKGVVNKDKTVVTRLFTFDDSDCVSVFYWGLCLPADKVTEVEEPKKWRAFTDIGEFQCVTNKFIGDIIEVKSDWDGRVYRCLIMWATDGYIGMAGLRFSLLIDLFEHYQWKDSNNEWQPFGVEE